MSSRDSSRYSRKGSGRSFRGSIKLTERENKILELFDKFKKPNLKQVNTIPLTDLYEFLLSGGIDIFKDERTRAVVKTLPSYSCLLSIDNIYLDQLAFQNFMKAGDDFILQCFERKLVIGDFNFLTKIVDVIGQTCVDQTSDQICNDIPHLRKQNPNNWGISVCSTDGQTYSQGNSKATFTLQDACKPFIYALALELFGEEDVDSYVGFQLTNQSAFAKILPKNKGINPMMEIGAVLLSSKIANKGLGGMSFAAKLDYVINFFKKFCGSRHICYNKSIYMSLKSNSHPYMAVAYFMEANKYFEWEHDVEADMEFYFQMRSLEVDCDSLCLMGATLANGGVSPVDKERVIATDTCRRLFSYMQFLAAGTLSPYIMKLVCLPIVFSISGLCLLILPWQMAFCLFSPKLDNKLKISSKSLQFITELEREFSVHPLGAYKGKCNALQLPPSRCKHGCLLQYETSRGDFINMTRYLDDLNEIHTTDYMGKNLLHLAVAGGHIKSVKFLHSICPILVNQTDVKGWTPKDYAKHFEHEDIFNLLEEYEQ